MRIAQIAPIIESVPPSKYGGTERVISSLTEELVRRGHDVTLFASGDSQTKAKLVSVYHTSLRKTHSEDIYGYNIWSLQNTSLAYQMQNQFDIIHDHTTLLSLPVANIAHVPVVMTLHGPITKPTELAFNFFTNPYLVTISQKQAKAAQGLNYAGNVYNGLPMQDYPFSNSHDGYLLFVGRVHIENGIDEKGLHHAIAVAEKLNMPLLIAAKLETDIPADVEYFQKAIKPRLSDKIIWLGEVDEVKRNQLMSHALCLLHTVNFSEPFGLTLIEAMACGCPVIAFNKGSIPEVIENGKTGFIVNNVQQAVRAVSQISKINRNYCRHYSLSRFSEKRMADDYELVYKVVMKNHEKKHAKLFTKLAPLSSPIEKND